MVDKNQHIPVGKPVADPNTPFHMQDVPRVNGTNAQGEILQQNNGLVQREGAAQILANLLKDPSVTIGFIKNIMLLQEIINLLSANNEALSKETSTLFGSLLVPPEELVPEMKRQENTSTVFKGPLFDLLRKLVGMEPDAPKNLLFQREGAPGQGKDGLPDMSLLFPRGTPPLTPEGQGAVVNLLKAISKYLGNKDVLGGVANSLTYLSHALESSPDLSGRLSELSEQFQSEDAGKNFVLLKQEVLALFKEVENSVLYNPKIEKMLSIGFYNLSRFSDNEEFLFKSINDVFSHLDGEPVKEAFRRAVQDFFTQAGTKTPPESSKIMDTLTKILARQADTEQVSMMDHDKVERVLHSLLSSPCNFTPLLHYVLPVQLEDIKSFAELWINPNGGEDRGGEAEKSLHLLMVFDIQSVGRFEAEMYIKGRTIDLSLLCPPAYAPEYIAIRPNILKSIEGTEYRFGKVLVDKLERPRSLMDVFRSLPYKRTGVDVKV